jgi:hypothetical protein
LVNLRHIIEPDSSKLVGKFPEVNIKVIAERLQRLVLVAQLHVNPAQEHKGVFRHFFHRSSNINAKIYRKFTKFLSLGKKGRKVGAEKQLGIFWQSGWAGLQKNA